jgi:phosphopantothenoylcysteine decarboxylase/phosphopantothenate--cysteine ligase
MRRIVLGVTGSIAAYKAAELVRLFVKNGDEVHVIMTCAACEFVKPLTFQTLSRNPVQVDQFAAPVSWKPEHISLAEAADLVIVAPATANTIAKMRYGIADNLLSAVLLATRAPTVVAPAMNTGMWESAVTQENIAALAARGVVVVEPDDGELACGVKGKGRMMEPEAIINAIAGMEA